MCQHIVHNTVHAVFPEICETERFQTAKVTFKVTDNGAFDRPDTISYSSSIATMFVSIVHRFRYSITYFLKYKEVTWAAPH